ncbi:Fpg/Nei family DNA glycosylase [Amycolatopsis sp. lyj-346]|uniref:Fpg/Nei family DNA glycosylase n=1 Tax=Amycolatopsis sp. lyj-346 TaxID=2789289 RepID=UPI00397BB512
MPELPEVEALAHHLRENAVGRTIFRIDVASLSVLKTARPPWTELHGREITGATRHGKHLDVVAGDLHLVVHLARAGWLRWSDGLAAAPLKPGKGPISLRVHLESATGPGFDLTEAGTKKGLAVWIVEDPQEIASVARLGPDALAVDAARLRELFAGKNTRLKWALTDQSLLAGIGNAYSDEIMHRAKLSPYATIGKLGEGALETLAEAIHEVETDAVERSVGQKAARLKGEKRSGLRVHARTGLPCPVCGDTIREISFADKSFQYCPTCQTGGKPLADRRMSRLLK